MNEQINIQWVEPNDIPDDLQIYFGEPYHLTDKITILQPTMQNIIDVGEKKFYKTLYYLIGNTTLFRSFLWDCKLDWNKMRDFELFRIWIQLEVFNDSCVDLFFDNFTFDGFEEMGMLSPEELEKPEEERVYKPILYNKEKDILITEKIYKRMALYLRTVFGIFPKVQKTRGRTTKEWLINEDKTNAKIQSMKKSEDTSTLRPLISFCLNHPGFKYKKNELRELGVAEFMDSVQRLQTYENSRAALQGSYSGFVDTSKMDRSVFDFTRDLSSKPKSSNTSTDTNNKDKNNKKNARSSIKKDDGTLKNKTEKFF